MQRDENSVRLVGGKRCAEEDDGDEESGYGKGDGQDERQESGLRNWLAVVFAKASCV